MSDTKREIAADLLSGAEQLKPFYSFPLSELDFSVVMEGKSHENIDRETLMATLLDQHQGLPDSTKTLENIRALADVNTFTVTTGHQLVLFGGPMFTLYKIATAIRMAEELQQLFPEKKIVPVFWMATEDHDFEEANHFHPNYCDTITWQRDWKGAVGRIPLGTTLGTLIPKGYGSWEKYFQKGMTYADAYRRFIHAIFGDKGLIILDADRAELKKGFLPVMQAEVKKQSAFHLVNQTTASLEEQGYKAQIHPREINLFYLAENSRERLEQTPGGFQTVDGVHKWNQDDLLLEMETTPDRFSPNVALRPLYQEMILPNLAYTGGWGELSYWMQLKGVFDAYNVQFPALIPRFTATLLTRAQDAKARQMGFQPSDFNMELPRLFDQYLPQVWDESPFRKHEFEIEEKYNELESYLEELDPTLAKSLAADRVRTHKRLERMYTKIKKSIRNKHSRLFNEIRDLKTAIQPTGQVQERVLHFSAFPVALPELLEIIYDNCQPFTSFDKKWIVLP